MNMRRIVIVAATAMALSAGLAGCSSVKGAKEPAPKSSTSTSAETTATPTAAATSTPTVKASPSASPAVTATSTTAPLPHLNYTPLDGVTLTGFPSLKADVKIYTVEMLKLMRDKYPLSPMPDYASVDVGNVVSCDGGITLTGGRHNPHLVVWCETPEKKFFLADLPQIATLVTNEGRVLRDLIVAYAAALNSQAKLSGDVALICTSQKLLKGLRPAIGDDRFNAIINSYVQSSDPRLAAGFIRVALTDGC